MNVEAGQKYKTRGGWTAYISTCVNGNPQGWCKDSFGNEEPSLGTWDAKTGKCLMRGDSTDKFNTEPFDLIERVEMTKPELLHRITGTETPLFVNERENCIIDKCLEIINEKSAVVSRGLTELTKDPFNQFNLKEHTLYKVRVKVSEHNIEHEAFLFTGFKTGAYCVVYTNSYEYPEPLNKIHSMEILQELTNIKIAS